MYTEKKAQALLFPPGAPKGPASGFGKETTREDYLARIEWERWAAAGQRKTGHEALAMAHDLARVAYEDVLVRKMNSGVWPADAGQQ